MQANLRVARLYFVLLALVTLGRWLQGVFGVPYERGHQVFSIVILTTFSTVYYGAFLRRFRGYRLIQAIGLGFLLGLTSQIVILLATVLSYALEMQTYFNHPRALNAEALLPQTLSFGQAMVVRFGGIVGNSIFAGIGGAVGWALGSLLPEQ